MNTFSAFSLLVIMVVLAAAPSASVALVVTRSATLGFGNGVSAAVGIVVGDVLLASLAILGMGVLAETMGSFFILLKICGGAYLIWLGLSLIRANEDVELRTADPPRLSLFASFVAGFVLTLGDIKAILFYASLFPTFIDMSRLAASDVAVIIIVTIAAVGGVKLFYVFAAERIAARFQHRRARRLVRSAAGVAMVGAGAYLITKS